MGDSRREAKPQLNAQYRDLVANILKNGGNPSRVPAEGGDPSRGLLLLRCAMLIISSLVRVAFILRIFPTVETCSCVVCPKYAGEFASVASGFGDAVDCE